MVVEFNHCKANPMPLSGYYMEQFSPRDAL